MGRSDNRDRDDFNVFRHAVELAVDAFVERYLRSRSVQSRNIHRHEHHVIVVKVTSEDGKKTYYIPVLVHFSPVFENGRYKYTHHVVVGHTIPPNPQQLEEKVQELEHGTPIKRSGKSGLKVPYGRHGRTVLEKLILLAAQLKSRGRNFEIVSTRNEPHPRQAAYRVLAYDLSGLESPFNPLHYYGTPFSDRYTLHTKFFHFYDYNDRKFHPNNLPSPEELEKGEFYHPRRETYFVARVVGPAHDEKIGGRSRPRIRE